MKVYFVTYVDEKKRQITKLLRTPLEIHREMRTAKNLGFSPVKKVIKL